MELQPSLSFCFYNLRVLEKMTRGADQSILTSVEKKIRATNMSWSSNEVWCTIRKILK